METLEIIKLIMTSRIENVVIMGKDDKTPMEAIHFLSKPKYLNTIWNHGTIHKDYTLNIWLQK